MKIRIRDNSVRLRLTRGEVEIVRDDGAVWSRSRFPGGRVLTYGLESDSSCVSPVAVFSDDTISVRMPAAMLLNWATTEQVSIQGESPLENSHSQIILVEKDFACLQPRNGEDESEMYANPSAGKANC